MLERRCGACSPIRDSSALVDNFAAQWLFLRNLQSCAPGQRRRSRTSTTTCARRSGRRPSCSSRASCARTGASSICWTADYTFVNERLARHYGIPNVYGSHFRRVTLDRREPPRAARPGQRAGGDLVSEPHVAGPARQVDSGKHSRHAAAGAAAERAAAARKPTRAARPLSVRERLEEHRKNPACATLPPRDGSARLLAREFRRHRQMADEGSGRRAGRRLGSARRRHAGRRSGGAATGAAGSTPSSSSAR